MEKALFAYIKSEIPHILLRYNIDQLFLDSEGADGINLGFYKAGNLDLDKKEGDPFNVWDTGDFFKKMRIDVKNRKIVITSTTSKLDEMLKNPSYLTVNFFGLTDENAEDFIKKWVKPFILQWARQQLKN